MKQKDYMFEQAAQEAINLLQKIISIPSISSEEDTIANFLERYIEEQGYTSSRLENSIWIMGPGFDQERPTLLLDSHFNTLNPTIGEIQKNFETKFDSRKLYDLRSNDTAACLVSLLQTFFLLTQEGQNYNIIFAASAQEELSDKSDMRKLYDELPKIDFALVGEPTEMRLSVAEQGLMLLDCTAESKLIDAAKDEGENAIYKALKDIQWIESYNFPKKSEFLGDVKMSVTQIEAGTQHNLIPDKCKFVVAVRSNELYSNKDLQKIIEEHLNSSVQIASPSLNASATPLNHPLVKRGREMGLQLFGSSILCNRALMDFPSVKIGPGESTQAHTADKDILFSEIKEAIETYYQLLNMLEINK